jgi:ABC-type lipoprotein release transport system permease subunit
MSRVLLAIAWRNLRRNAQRTGLTLSAIAVGLAALIGLWSFSEGLQRNMVRNFQDTIVGSLQVHRRGFFQRPELTRDIGQPAAVLRALEVAGVRHWTWRLEAFGLAAGARGSAGVLIMGMDPEREGRVTRFAHRVSQGRFLTGSDTRVCVIGSGTAHNLGVELGEPVALMAYDRFGALAAEELRVVGLVTTGEMGIDRGVVVVPLAALQGLLEMEGRVTSVVARLPEAALETGAAAVRAALGEADYEVLAWHQMFPVLQQWVRLSDGFHYILLAVLLLVVLGGALNTVLLSTLERTRELGVLMALGMSTRQVRAMIAAEALTLGALGTLIGAALGLLVAAWLARAGLDLSVLLGATGRFYMDPVIYAEINTGHLLAAMAASFVTTALAGVYPALLASGLEPAEAMRRA